jgi:acyl carrier protein
MPTLTNDAEIITAIKETLAEIVGTDPTTVTAEASFADDLQIDSLSMVEVVVAVEERFEIRIPDKDFQFLVTVGDAIAYVKNASQLDAVK